LKFGRARRPACIHKHFKLSEEKRNEEIDFSSNLYFTEVHFKKNKKMNCKKNSGTVYRLLFTARTSIFTFYFLLFTVIGFAQTDSVKINPLNEVVITATKTDVKESFTGKVVTVIPKDQLQKMNGLSLTQILNQQSGIDIIGANNSPGTNQDVYVRGAATGSTLILIDGIPVSDPSQIENTFDLNFIPVSMIDRIEILKGSQSTLYGSDAMAGVTNIITKKTGQKPFSVDGQLDGGSFTTVHGNVGITGEVNKFNYAAAYDKFYSKGFSSAYDSTGKQHFDDDGINRDAFFGNAGYQFSTKERLSAFGTYSNYKTGLDEAAFEDDTDYFAKSTDWEIGLSNDFKLNNSIDWKLNYRYEYSARNYLNDSGYVNPNAFENYSSGKYSGKNHFAETYFVIPIGKYFHLLPGISFASTTASENYISLSPFGNYSETLNPDSANTTQLSGYLSAQLLNYNHLSLEAGGRFNHHSQYGNSATFSFSPSYLLNDFVKFYVNISSAYKVPTLYQLYSIYGNKNLLPEQSLNYEAGAEFYFMNKQATFRATAFRTNYTNIIIFFTDPSTFASYYLNQDKEYRNGIEAEINLLFAKDFSFDANATYVDGQLTTKTSNETDTTYDDLYRVPKFSGNATLSFQPDKKWFASVNVYYSGKRIEPQFDLPSLQLNAYALLNATVQYQIVKQVKAFINFNNILNTTYFVVPGYNSAGFNFDGGISFNF
jgi:vitamin B12 transporter